MYKRMMKMCVIALASISMLAGCATSSTRKNETVGNERLPEQEERGIPTAGNDIWLN